MKTFCSTITFLFLLLTTQAQRICGSVEYAQKLAGSNSPVQKMINRVSQLQRPTAPERDTLANEIIYIPVVVHVLYNTAAQNLSDAQILSQLTVLNNDFSNQNADRMNTPEVFRNLSADTRIKFCLAQVGPDNKGTTGIIRKQTSIAGFSADDAMKENARGGDNAWDSKKYLNIWVCSLGGRSLGYATPPGGQPDLDGVVIAYDVFGVVGNLRSPFNKGRTATHEIGHWLALKHLWGDAICGDDGIEDTPQQQSYNFGCPSFPHLSACSADSNGDMFMNYMDFSDDACMNMFTVGQKKKMRAMFATGNLRNSFLTSFACDSTLVQAGPTPIPPVAAPVAAAVDVFNVFPNPVQSDLTIEYKPAAEMITKSIHIYSAVGVNVFTGELSKEKSTFNLSHFPAGMYIVRIGDGTNVFIKKIFKL